MSEKRGRPKKRKLDDFQDLLLKYKSSIILENGKVCSKSHDIWQTISCELLEVKSISIPKSS